jgi:hypothetical protein
MKIKNKKILLLSVILASCGTTVSAPSESSASPSVSSSEQSEPSSNPSSEIKTAEQAEKAFAQSIKSLFSSDFSATLKEKEKKWSCQRIDGINSFAESDAEGSLFHYDAAKEKYAYEKTSDGIFKKFDASYGLVEPINEIKNKITSFFASDEIGFFDSALFQNGILSLSFSMSFLNGSAPQLAEYSGSFDVLSKTASLSKNGEAETFVDFGKAEPLGTDWMKENEFADATFEGIGDYSSVGGYISEIGGIIAAEDKFVVAFSRKNKEAMGNVMKETVGAFGKTKTKVESFDIANGLSDVFGFEGQNEETCKRDDVGLTDAKKLKCYGTPTMFRIEKVLSDSGTEIGMVVGVTFGAAAVERQLVSLISKEFQNA